MFCPGPGCSEVPTARTSLAHLVLAMALLLLVAGCATKPYVPASQTSYGFVDRATSQSQGDIHISTAVPTAEETLALTGIDLYSQGIQPVWLEISNRSDRSARLITWSIDRDYFSPIEVAYMNRKAFTGDSYEQMQAWFHNSAMPRDIAAGETRAGLVYTHLRPGTKGFNLTLIHAGTALDFTFFVPLPGFVPDFMQVDFAKLYAPEQVRDLALGDLRAVLETELGCCATDVSGELQGGPLNTVMVASGAALRRAMLRGDWIESSMEHGGNIRAREQHFQSRPPDAIYWKLREDGNERIQLHLWLAPWRVSGELVWVAQVFYYTDETPLASVVGERAGRDSELYTLLANESVMADIDSAQNFLLQNLWYNGSLRATGFVGGVGKVDVDNPLTGFGGAAYYTKGMRMVAFLGEEARALDEVALVFRSEDPIQPVGGQVFGGRQVPPPNDRLHTNTSDVLNIATAVPSRDEAKQIFGSDLYRKGVQPVWVQVENRSDNVLHLAPMGLDEAYFTPRETANRLRSGATLGHARKYEERSHSRLWVAPNSIQSGYIFSRVDEGTKSFNVDVIGDDEVHLMSFFVPVPGLKIDHHNVDLNKLYKPEEVQELALPELVAALEAMPCCVRDANGSDKGDPLNLVFIGEPRDMYYAFMRAGWDETETIYGASLWKTAASALTGGRYRYSPVSALYVFERAQDVALQRARTSIHERNHLRLWMTPLRHEGVPVWIGQISRDIGVRFTRKTITTHKIDPDVDETREFLLEDLAFNQVLKAYAYIGGVGEAGYDEPRGNLTGDPYFTDGRRAVMWIASEPMGIDEIERRDLSVYLTGKIGP